MATFLYARVSSVDQTLEHQKTQAEAAGFKFDHILADYGVSGVSTRLRERPEGRRLFDMLRRGDILVVRWVDRLGRNYRDVTGTLREFINRGVRIETVVNRMVFDGATTDPMQQALRDALLAFMAAMAQAQAEITKAAQKAGIEHARTNDDGTKYRGRKPTYTWSSFRLAQRMLAEGTPITTVAKTTGIKRQSLHRIRQNPLAAEAALHSWYPTVGANAP
jgi:putative DNA-invertase from lambdoid prophage Rac